MFALGLTSVAATLGLTSVAAQARGAAVHALLAAVWPRLAPTGLACAAEFVARHHNVGAPHNPEAKEPNTGIS